VLYPRIRRRQVGLLINLTVRDSHVLLVTSTFRTITIIVHLTWQLLTLLIRLISLYSRSITASRASWYPSSFLQTLQSLVYLDVGRKMASNGASPSEAVTRVVTAYEQTTKANLSQAQKAEALQYLEAFQKSVRRLSWFHSPFSLPCFTPGANTRDGEKVS
jgi:hypothetical protein